MGNQSHVFPQKQTHFSQHFINLWMTIKRTLSVSNLSGIFTKKVSAASPSTFRLASTADIWLPSSRSKSVIWTWEARRCSRKSSFSSRSSEDLWYKILTLRKEANKPSIFCMILTQPRTTFKQADFFTEWLSYLFLIAKKKSQAQLHGEGSENRPRPFSYNAHWWILEKLNFRLHMECLVSK